jgi:TPR repeat protein
MFVAVPYTIYGWVPPELSPSERIWLGGEIAKVGRKFFVAALKQRLSAPARGKNKTSFTFAEILEDAKRVRDGGTNKTAPPIRAILVAVIFFGGGVWIIASHPRLLVTFLIAMAVVVPISMGSLFLMYNKIDRWAQSLIDDYADAAANSRAEAMRARIAKQPAGNQSSPAILQRSSPTVSKALESEEIARICRMAQQGEARAQNDLGLMYAAGCGVEKDEREAAAWYRKAAEQGYAIAQYNLGIAYERGRGVQKDEREAVGWYRKAAEQGYAPAESNLGVMLEIGSGVGKNEREAFAWALKAAKQGHAAAQRNVGAMYADGRGVERDDRAALSWMTKAAEKGHARAQFNLGTLYELGRGVDKNERQALAWYRKAADQGNPDARARMRALALKDYN